MATSCLCLYRIACGRQGEKGWATERPVIVSKLRYLEWKTYIQCCACGGRRVVVGVAGMSMGPTDQFSNSEVIREGVYSVAVKASHH